MERIHEATKREKAVAPLRSVPQPVSSSQHPLLQLQHLAGNQAVGEWLKRNGIHAKLSISRPDDPEEREADQVADRVMRAHSGAPISSPCSCSESDEKCEECQQKQSTIARKSDGASSSQVSHPGVDRMMDSPGRPMDTQTRSFFEPRFGRDLSHVRLHTDDDAGAAARSIQALAFARGNHIAFAPGQFDTNSDRGRTLLAHELAHTFQQQSKRQASAEEQRVQRQDDGGAPPQPVPQATADLDQQYQAAVASARQNGDWQDAAEKLNGFNRDDINARLAQLGPGEPTLIHNGAVQNPRVGPQSQLALMTEPASQPGGTGSDANRAAQVSCVARLGGCIQTRDAGVPSTEDITNYNQSCRGETSYTGPDVTPTDDECTNLPLVPLSTGEKILIGGFLLVGAAVVGAALAVAGAEIIPVVIASVGEAAVAGWGFYLANAIVVNEIGVFAVGLILSCEGNVSGLVKAITEDPAQAAQFLIQVYILHVNISINSQPARPATVPVQVLPPEEQTEEGQIRFRTVGAPTFEDEGQNGGNPGGPPSGIPGQTPGGEGRLPQLTPEEQLKFLNTQRGFGSSAPGIPAVDPKGVGAPMGKGYETYAAVQIVDKDGYQVRVGIGAYLGGGGPHGEEGAIGALKAGLPKGVDVSGGKMIVTVEKEPCGGCDSAIKQFAKELNLADYEVYVPSRASMTDPTASVSAKQASRTVFQGNRPPTTPKQVPNQ